MARLTPPMSINGVFSLKAPFNADPRKAYRVTAIRSFQEILSRGTDPIQLVYTPVDRGKALYDQDRAAGALIVTLRASDGSTIYVPDTHILAFPNMGNVNYSQLVLAISCGALPVSYDTTVLEQAVRDVVRANLGAAPTVVVARSPIAESISSDEHIQLTAARRGHITANRDDKTIIRELEATIATMQERINLYETYISQLGN